MHASMVTLLPKEGQLENMVTKYTTDLLPELLARPGLIKSYVFADPQSNVVRLLAFWETPEHAGAPETRATFQRVIQGISPYLANQPTRDLFEVRYGE